jgi:hypothetical protein
MTTEIRKPVPPVIVGSDSAPIIYCDVVTASGLLNQGVIQLELAANVLVPTEQGKVRIKTRMVAQVRFPLSQGPVIRQAILKAESFAAQPSAAETQQ